MYLTWVDKAFYENFKYDLMKIPVSWYLLTYEILVSVV